MYYPQAMMDNMKYQLPLASGLGFEPRLLGPKPSVLPLDDPEI